VKKIACILVIIFRLFDQSNAQQLASQQAVIGFYNLENLFDTVDDPAINDAEFLPDGANNWTEERYKIKLNNMSKVIASMRPDVLGLGEIENRKVLEDLVTHPNIAALRYQIVHFNMRDERGVDVAMIYRPSVFKPFSIKIVPIIDAAEPEFKTRDILWVKGLCLGDTVHVAVNHWPSRRTPKEEKRLIAAGAARNAVDSVLAINPHANIILMGDLNDDPTNRSVKKVLLASDNKAKKGTLINVAEPTFKKGYGTLLYDGVWNLFDQIIISADLNDKKGVDCVEDSFTVFVQRWMQEPSGKYKGAPQRTFRSGAFNPEGYSDHLPVYITLKKYQN
jgi:endonuclease/exonuclease/phosphatase family metal-dependent hydrolase